MKIVNPLWIKQLHDKQLTCLLCGELINSSKDLTYSLIFTSNKLSLDNVCPAHKCCNDDKANLNLEEYWTVKEILDEGR